MNNLFCFFASGFFYVFGLSENPLKKMQSKYNKSNDAKNLHKDWENVGMSIKQVYEREKEYSEKTGIC